MLKLKLLTKEDLEVLNRNLLSAGITDYEKSFGGRDAWATDIMDLKQYAFPKSEGAYISTIVSASGYIEKMQPWENAVGIRPAIKYSEIERGSQYVGLDENGITCVKYGEYPQTKLSDKENARLTLLFKMGLLTKTKHKYSMLNARPVDFSTLLCFESYLVDCLKPVIELQEYRGETGSKYVKKDDSWYRVEPIIWQVDKKHDIALTKNVLTSGLLYGACPIEKFIKEYLSKEIVQPTVSKVKVTKINLKNILEDMNLNKEKTASEIGISEKVKAKR